MFQKISQNSQENTCARVSFLIKLQASTCNFIKKETLAQLFSCEFCEIFKEHLFLQATPRQMLLKADTIPLHIHSKSASIFSYQHPCIWWNSINKYLNQIFFTEMICDGFD